MRTDWIRRGLWVATAAMLAGCAQDPGTAALEAGLRDLKHGNWDRARTRFEKVLTLRRDPADHAPAYNYIGIAQWKLGRLDDARRAFEDSRRSDPALVDPVYNLGVLALEQGDTARALRLLGEAAAMDPGDPRALEMVASIQISQERWPEARRSLSVAQERAPGSPRVATMLAIVEERSGYPDRAEGMLLETLDTHPKYAPAFFNLAVLNYTKTADRAHAAELFRKFLALDPPAAQAAYARKALEQLAPAGGGAKPREPAAGAVTQVVARATATQAAARVRLPRDAGRPAGAATNAPPRRGMDPDSVLAAARRLADSGQPEQALGVCLSLAESAAQTGRADVQEKALAGAASICYFLPKAHVEYGRFLLRAKRTDDAFQAFKRAIALDKDHGPAHLGMAEAAVAAGEFDAAIIGFRDAIRCDPGAAEAPWGLAKLYDEQLGKPGDAARAYRDFAVRFPRDARTPAAATRMKQLDPTLTLAPPGTATSAPPARATAPGAEPVNLAALPQPARHITVRKAAARNPAAADQWFYRGVQHQQRQEVDASIQAYLRALEQNDQLAEAFYGLGVLYGLKGEPDLAKDGFLRALAIKPGLEAARFQLAWLYTQDKDRAAAIRLAEDLVRTNPGHASGHQLLGYLYAQDPATHALAKRHYEQFLALAPAHADARAVRKWIETH